MMADIKAETTVANALIVGSCFALSFLQTIAVTMLLQFGEDPENTPSLQSHENTH